MRFLAVALAAILALLVARPPAPRLDGPPEDAFSAERAMRHVERIARKPHPVGSQENARVRKYLVERLDGLGLAVSILEAQVPRAPVAKLFDIVARRRGTDSTRPLLIVAHYDSTPRGPGAGDDGAAVAAVLETLRALSATPLRNDLVILLTDGEEAGLLGARAFVRLHPLAREAGLVLNFEGRGNAGSSLMFETSLPNGWIVREFAKAAPRPAAHSLMAEVYRRMPNDTDFTVFDGAGLRGLNFAMIDGATAYHTLLDTPQNLSRRSLQHHGSNMLALTHHFGNADLAQESNESVVYFDVLQRFVVVYGTKWVWPLTAAALLLFGASAWLRRRELSGKGVTAGFVLQLAAVVVSTALAFGITEGLKAIAKTWTTKSDPLFFLALVAASLSITACLTRWGGRRWGMQSVAMGARLWWLLLLCSASAFLPAASVVFLWPLVLSLMGTAGAAALVVVLAPFVRLLFVAMALRSAFVPVPVVALALGAIAPQIAVRRLGMAGSLACMGLLAVGVLLL